MRHILSLVVALGAAGCGAFAAEEAGVTEAAASTEPRAEVDDEDDGRTAGGFDVRGKIERGQLFSFHFKKDNVSVIAFDASPDAPLDAAVITTTEGAQVHIDIHGPMDLATGKFGPLLARGEIEQQARVRDLKVPSAGIYVILASELGNTEADYTAVVQASATPRAHASATQTLHGPKAADEAERRAGFDAICADWKKRMFELSRDHIDYITCGTPKQRLGESKVLESTATVVISAKVGEGEEASTIEDSSSLTAAGVDEDLAAKWQDACFSKLTKLKAESPARFLVGTCARVTALGVRAGEAWVETWSGSADAVLRK